METWINRIFHYKQTFQYMIFKKNCKTIKKNSFVKKIVKKTVKNVIFKNTI